MYKIRAGDTVIYNDGTLEPDQNAINPKLVLEDSAAGSLSFTLAPGNPGYSSITKMTTDITVLKDDEEIWWGRALSEEYDFWNQRSIECEGALAFLNDVTQPTYVYENMTIREYFAQLFYVYNQRVPASRRFSVGAVTVNAGARYKFVVNFEKTIELINKVVSENGGHLIISRDTTTGGFKLDYLKDYVNSTEQVIEFGKNLLDMKRSWDAKEWATVVIPLGAKLETQAFEDVENRLTVASVNGGSIYVVSDFAQQYGWYETMLDFGDISDPQLLMTKATEYLTDMQFDSMELEITALDLHYLSRDIEEIRLLDRVRMESVPHGIAHLFPVRKMDISLDNPENTVLTLGDKRNATLTGVQNAVNLDLLNKIKGLPTSTFLLEAAKANAAEIMNLATTGYVTIVQGEDGTDAIYISDTKDYNLATNLWRWNMNGLGFSGDGGRTWETAITMDGQIVANFITAGTLSGDIIQGGTITGDKLSIEYKDSVDTAIGNAVDASARQITQQFQAADSALLSRISSNADNISELYQDINGLGLTYTSGGQMTGSIQLTKNGVAIGSPTAITMTGAVTFNDLSDSGSSVINGDNITTGTINGSSMILNRTDGAAGSQIWFSHNSNPYGWFRFDNNGAGTDVESQNRIYLATLPNTSIKIASGAGASVTGQRVYERGEYYVTLEAGGFYDQGYSPPEWERGAINLGNVNTYTQATARQCLINLWGDARVNNSPIITAANISQYIPSSSTAVFG